MRITIVTGPFLPTPPAPCGSVERLFHDLAIEFARRKHKVTVVSRGHEMLKDREFRQGVLFLRRGRYTRSGRIGTDVVKDLAYSLQVLPILPKADILVTNCFWLPVFARHLRADAGKLVVIVQRYPKNQMILYGSAQRIVTVSQAIKTAIVHQFARVKSRIRVFPNPVDASAFVPPATPRTFAGIQNIVYTGRVNPEKGLDILIKAFRDIHAHFPQSRLKIVGPSDMSQGGGGEPFVAELKQLANGLPVEFTGAIYDRNKLADVLRDACVYCYPSVAEKGEALPVAPIEAMATGVVPVVSDLDCFHDYIIHGQNGFMFPRQGSEAPIHLATIIKNLLADPERANQIGATAARHVQSFSTENVASVYLNEFADMLKGRPPGQEI